MTWGKLRDPDRPGGAILRGSDYAITRRSQGLPDDLVAACMLPMLLGPGAAVGRVLDPANADLGALISRPACLPSGNHVIFARVQSLSEEGQGRPGRRFDQLTALIVAAEDWAPDLLPVMYESLFFGPYANMDEVDDPLRLGCPMLQLTVPEPGRPPAHRVESLSPETLPCTIRATTQRGAVQALAHRLSVAQGGKLLAALPWALGLDDGAPGPAGGFAIRLHGGLGPDQTQGGMDGTAAIPSGLSPWFSFADFVADDGSLTWAEWVCLPLRNLPVDPVALHFLGDLPERFRLPPPFHGIGFADFALNVTEFGHLAEHLWRGGVGFFDHLWTIRRGLGHGQTPVDVLNAIELAYRDKGELPPEIESDPLLMIDDMVWKALEACAAADPPRGAPQDQRAPKLFSGKQ